MPKGPNEYVEAQRAREHATMWRRVADEFDAIAATGVKDARFCSAQARDYRETARRYDALADHLEQVTITCRWCGGIGPNQDAVVHGADCRTQPGFMDKRRAETEPNDATG